MINVNLKKVFGFFLGLFFIVLLVGCNTETDLNKIVIMNNKNLKVGETNTLAVETDPEGINVSVIWGSSDYSVATISESGVVTALSEGTAVITAKYETNQKIRSSVTIIVSKGYGSDGLESIKIMNNKNLKVGEVNALYLTTIPEAISFPVKWISSSPNIVSVNEYGLVTGLSEGTAAITAICTTDETIRNTVTITVKGSSGELGTLESIAILNNKDLKVGDSNVLSIATTPSGLTPTIVWSSSDETVVTIAQNGMVTALKEGSAIITAKSSDDETIKNSVIVIVSNTATSLEEIKITNNKNVGIGETNQLGIETVPSGAAPAVTWSSSDETIATVSSTGLVKGIKEGTVTITCKYSDSIKATVEVKVSGSSKITSGVDVNVNDAAIENYLGTGKLYVTTFGQASRSYLVEMVDEAISGSSITYTYDEQLMAADVEAGSLVIAVVGFTSKGIAGSITQTGEKTRATAFSNRDDITLVIVQLDGKARRGESSDPIIEEAVKGAEVVLIYDSGKTGPTADGANYDGFYTNLCSGKLFYSFSDEWEMNTYFSVMCGLNA